jgi:hypothetical protein
MRSCSGEPQRLSLYGLIVHCSKIVYWGFFLRSNCLHFVSVLHEFQIRSGSYGVLPVHLSSVLLKDFRLVILPIRSDWTVDYTCPRVECELVSLVAIIFRVFTQGDGEGKYSLYLEQTVVKLTRAPWSVNPRLLCGSLHQGVSPLSRSPS